MNKFLIAIIALGSVTSCTSVEEKVDAVHTLHSTPDVLIGANSEFKVSSSLDRYDSDIIEDLFQEAIAKDSKLRELTGRIHDSNELREDSLRAYTSYVFTNEKYWTLVQSYIQRVSDSTMRKDIHDLFSKHERNYHSRVQGLEEKRKSLDLSEQQLKDRFVVMKLLVTQPMIENYQRNELPNISSLEYVKKTYDSLNTVIKRYTLIGN